MDDRRGRTGRLASGDAPIQGVLFDLLMAVMNSPAVWAAAAGDGARGMAWRDAVTARMVAASTYRPYEELVRKAAGDVGLGPAATGRLLARWPAMEPWPDAGAIGRLDLLFGFATNTSAELARVAARRAPGRPMFVLSAEEAGCFKPDPRFYREACRRLGTAPGRTLFVAGAPYDATGAARAGLRSVLVVRRAGLPNPGGRVRLVESLEAVRDALQRRY